MGVFYFLSPVQMSCFRYKYMRITAINASPMLPEEKQRAGRIRLVADWRALKDGMLDARYFTCEWPKPLRAKCFASHLSP